MRERHECHCMLFLTEDNDFVGTDKNISFDEVQELSAGFGTWESEMKSEREQERENEWITLWFGTQSFAMGWGRGRENCVCFSRIFLNDQDQ